MHIADDQARDTAERVGQLLNDVDRSLLELRMLPQSDMLSSGLAHAEGLRQSGGIALIAPSGRVLGATPDASTTGWIKLMRRLAKSPDVLAVGETVPRDDAQGGELGEFRNGLLPVARRLTAPDGSFAGIIMYSINGGSLFPFPPAIVALGGYGSLVDDEGTLLARTQNLPEGPAAGGSAFLSGLSQYISGSVTGTESLTSGVERIFSYRRIEGLPLTVITGLGREAAFADWRTMRVSLLGAIACATGLVVMTFMAFRTQRMRARIGVRALPVILSNISDGVQILDRRGNLISANDAGKRLKPPTGKARWATAREEDGRTLRTSRHRLMGGGTVLIGTDMTALQEAETRAKFLTDHDQLTSLPNRWRAATYIQERIAAHGENSGRIAALIQLDLDGFQDINDTFGHEIGDEVLVEVASRLRDLAPGEDMAARLGGDEFMLFMDNPGAEATILSMARHLPMVLARPITVRGTQVRLGVSLGVAVYPKDGTDTQTLFRHADIALSEAKSGERGRARNFEPAMLAAFEEHRMMESDLRSALDNNELELKYQPQFDCKTLEITGFEALARWKHPTRGDLSPAIFIPMAERSGLINPLGLWAIEAACNAGVSWTTRQRVAVNLSPIQLHSETIEDDIRAILARTQFPAHLLELEVTENVLMDEKQRTLRTLHRLRAMDVRITLDDFGTGYSSLSYLQRFPFDKIKIDKSFIQGQTRDRGTRVILEAMIRMCTDLGFEVVAEGVETDHQLAVLRDLGCQEIQGFLMAQPLKASDVEPFVLRHANRASVEQAETAAT